MPPIETDKDTSPVTTPKPRSIASVNGATTTPPVILKETPQEDLLGVEKPSED